VFALLLHGRFIFPRKFLSTKATLFWIFRRNTCPLMLVLAFSHLVFFNWLGRNRGNTLDKAFFNQALLFLFTAL